LTSKLKSTAERLRQKVSHESDGGETMQRFKSVEGDCDWSAEGRCSSEF